MRFMNAAAETDTTKTHSPNADSLPQRALGLLRRKYRRALIESLVKNPPLPLPAGASEQDLRALLDSLELPGGIPHNELAAFRSHFKRFVYTLGLVPEGPGLRVLELGADPFFTTTLISRYRRPAQYSLANFAPGAAYGAEVQRVVRVLGEETTYTFKSFNAEREPFPYEDSSFDLVLFCEMIEHFPDDPVHTLTEVRRVLAPGGHLVLTTPNAARLENVCRMVNGEAVADGYSGYGVYGRHNREFTMPEIVRLLSENGFEVERAFTADVEDDWSSPNFRGLARLKSVLKGRDDLGQYQFSRSRVTEESKRRAPFRGEWIYRSLTV